MPFIYLGITRDAGVSKKTGSAYDIAFVHYADDAGNTVRPDRKIAMGLEGKSLPVSIDAISRFGNLPPLTTVNFEFEPDPRNMERNRICGFKLIPKQSQQQQAS